VNYELIAVAGFFIMVATPKLDDWFQQQGSFVWLGFLGLITFLFGVINMVWN
jgi:hypothetical protein